MRIPSAATSSHPSQLSCVRTFAVCNFGFFHIIIFDFWTCRNFFRAPCFVMGRVVAINTTRLVIFGRWVVTLLWFKIDLVIAVCNFDHASKSSFSFVLFKWHPNIQNGEWIVITRSDFNWSDSDRLLSYGRNIMLCHTTLIQNDPLCSPLSGWATTTGGLLRSKMTSITSPALYQLSCVAATDHDRRKLWINDPQEIRTFMKNRPYLFLRAA